MILIKKNQTFNLDNLSKKKETIIKMYIKYINDMNSYTALSDKFLKNFPKSNVILLAL
jgi:hypothetical protein